MIKKTVDRPDEPCARASRGEGKDMFDAKGRLSPGWWLLPFIVMGLLVWSVSLGLLFG